MPPKKDNRPVFKLDGQDVKAGGIIFYRYGTKSIDLLLSASERSMDDLGGCTDIEDPDIYYTVAREVEEESNKKFNKKNLIKRLKQESTQYIYTPKSKYVIFILKASDDEKKFKKEDFGEKEIHDNIERQVKWIPLEFFLQSDTIQNKLNWRLRNAKLFNIFKEIKNKKFGGNIFSKHLTSTTYNDSSSEDLSSDSESSDGNMTSTTDESSDSDISSLSDTASTSSTDLSDSDSD